MRRRFPGSTGPAHSPLGLALLVALGLAAGCRTPPPGALVVRRGDEIVVAGQWVHTGTPVVLWTDPGGYDAYRVERRFSPFGKSDWRDSAAEVSALSTPNRYGFRANGLTDEEIERMRCNEPSTSSCSISMPAAPAGSALRFCRTSET